MADTAFAGFAFAEGHRVKLRPLDHAVVGSRFERCDDLGPVNVRRADLYILAVAHKQHLVQFNILGVWSDLRQFDLKTIALSDFILLTALLNNRVHHYDS